MGRKLRSLSVLLPFLRGSVLKLLLKRGGGMDCREAERKMSHFIQRELTEDETAEFLEHIRCCSACRRELETNFFLLEGLRVLDTDSDDFDGKRAMERELRHAFLRLRRARLRRKLTLRDGCADRRRGCGCGTFDVPHSYWSVA